MTNKIVAHGRDKKRSKRKAISPKTNPRFPNFGAMFFGFLMGVFSSCLLIYMFATNDITLKLPTIGSKKKDMVVSSSKVVAKKETPEPRYDFYTELAKSETSQVQDLKKPIQTINGYRVQVGSFRKAADAEAMRAKLTLNGYSAVIEQNKKANGELLHCVLLGTYAQEQQAKAIQSKLKALAIDSTLVLKYAN